MLKTQSRMNHHKDSSWEEEGKETRKRGWIEDMRSTGPKGQRQDPKGCRGQSLGVG